MVERHLKIINVSETVPKMDLLNKESQSNLYHLTQYGIKSFFFKIHFVFNHFIPYSSQTIF